MMTPNELVIRYFIVVMIAITGVYYLTKGETKMVTENQARKSAMALAHKVKEQADSDWQLVVDKLNQKIADLESELNKKEDK